MPGGSKNRFYNPILQNQSHIKWLGRYLADDIPLFSIVVFLERCELKKVTILSDDIHIIKRDRLYATIREIWRRVDDVLMRLLVRWGRVESSTPTLLKKLSWSLRSSWIGLLGTRSTDKGISSQSTVSKSSVRF